MWIVTEKRFNAKVAELEARIKDLERHFVTKRDENGQAVETLADVPVERRKEIKPRAGMSWDQKRRFLEATDGGRRLA